LVGTTSTGASARVTGSAKAHRKLTATAAETAPALAKNIKVTQSAEVKGQPQLGRVLKARGGDFLPSNAFAAYTWLRDGKPIPKATNGPYTVRRKDVGRTLSLRVTLTRKHFRDVSETVAVPGPVTSVPTMRVRTDAARGRVTVDVKVKAPGVAALTGAITVTVGGRSVEGQLADGLVVRKIRRGNKQVIVRYAGTELVAPTAARSTVEVR
jgi:hypothetical protein